MSNNELLKTIEAQGKLITELRAELEEIKSLATKVVTHYYESEQTHYEEYEDEDKPQDHIFLTLLKLEDELYKNQ